MSNPNLEQQLREMIRVQNKSDDTAEAYWGWIKTEGTLEASLASVYNYSLLLQGLASWVSRFYLHMGKRTGQLYCCARSLTSVRQPVRFTRLDWRSGI